MSRFLALFARPGALFALAAALLVAEEAFARVGGGQSFSRGSSRSSGGGGGGGGVDLDLILLLLRLCIEYPAFGIPALIVLGIVIYYGSKGNAAGHHSVIRAHGRPAATRRARRSPVEALARRDKAFSLPVLLDYLQLVHRRALEAVARGDWEALAPFVGAPARDAVMKGWGPAEALDEVVVGAVRLKAVNERSDATRIEVEYETTHLLTRSGRQQRLFTASTWTFQRAPGATSLPPEDTLRLGCPSCGAAVETDTMGRCRNCETPITDGRLQWQAVGVRVEQQIAIQPPEVSRWSGQQEPGVGMPTVLDPDLPRAWRGLQGRHPDFAKDAFEGRVRHIFLSLQQAWSENRWEQARPFVTDPMFQTLRFWVERYRAHGLRNRMEDVSIDRLQVVSIRLDAWYEAVTVRFWARAKDSVVDANGKVIGGNADLAREFSEYWTFIRAVGGGGASGDPHHCPSCGAPLDNVSQTGVCGYCDSKITTGRFDWVLSRIDQPEAYVG